ncbi:MAG: tetratricopeptide repeat protein [Prevotella sp.]
MKTSPATYSDKTRGGMLRLAMLLCLMLLMTAAAAMPACAGENGGTMLKSEKKAKAKKADRSKKAGKTKTADRLSPDDRRRFDIFFLEALMQHEKGNKAATFDLLRLCEQLDADAPEVNYYLALYYATLKDKERALAYFKKAAALNPDNTFYLETLAQAYIAKGMYDEGIAALEKLMEGNTDRDDVLSMLVQLYLGISDYDNVIRTLERLEVLEGKGERLSFAKCDIYMKQGRHDDAIREMKILADQYPYDLNYRVLYAESLMQGGKEEEAKDVLDGVLGEEPGNARALIRMFEYHKLKGDTLHAEELMRRALVSDDLDSEQRITLLTNTINASMADNAKQGDPKRPDDRIFSYFALIDSVRPGDAEVYKLLASYMNFIDMPEEKIKPVCERIIEIEPDDQSARFHLVAYALEKKDYNEAIAQCAAARQYNPDQIVFYYYQGLSYYFLNREDEALEVFRAATDMISDDTTSDMAADFYSLKGDLLYKKGLYDEAFAAYDSCLQWRGDDISCLNNYAYYLSELDRELDKAEKMSYKAITAEPENGTYLDTYAWILFRQQRYAEAKIYIDRAVRNDADSSAVILEHAGDIYALNGNIEEAVRLWQEAARKAPENKLLIRKIKQKKYIK